jgi:uncharacterized protein YuzE
MKINYHPDTDSLYIDLSGQISVESREVSDGVVLDSKRTPPNASYRNAGGAMT